MFNKRLLLSIPIFFLVGCSEKTVTEDMLIGKWDCQNENYESISFDEDAGNVVYEEDNDSLEAKKENAIITYEKIKESPNLNFKRTYQQKMNNDKQIYKVSSLNVKNQNGESNSSDGYFRYYYTSYNEFEYINQDEYKIHRGFQMISYEQDSNIPFRASGFKQTTKCNRIK